jgi:ADP-ribose pyrophosphatase YjhB (NUDIX family)
MARGWEDAVHKITPKRIKGSRKRKKKNKDPLHRWGTQDQPFYHPGANPVSDVILTRNGSQEVLLVRRSDGIGKGKGDAYHGVWSLPGGFQDTYAKKGEEWKADKETSAEAALRELREETGLDLQGIEQSLRYVGFFKHTENDPRNNKAAWAHKNVYTFDLPAGAADNLKGSDDATEARWFSLEEITSLHLAFDQKETLRKAGIL